MIFLVFMAFSLYSYLAHLVRSNVESLYAINKPMYKLFYNPSVLATALRPVLSLSKCLQDANAGNISYRTNLVRLNWMINDLHHNPIQKPLLIDGAFRVLTGDTRLMALQLHPKITRVPALMTSTVAPHDWKLIGDKLELGKLLKINPDDILTNWDWHKKPLDWIEFAYSHTSDHMHDESQRARMIANYLAKYPDTIFDQDWLLSSIDWSLYDH